MQSANSYEDMKKIIEEWITNKLTFNLMHWYDRSEVCNNLGQLDLIPSWQTRINRAKELRKICY